MQSLKRIPITFLTTPLLLAVIFLIWHTYVRAFNVSAFILPPPMQVFSELGNLIVDPVVWRHTVATVYASVMGFLYACVIGVGLGGLLGKVPWLEKMLNPFIVATQVIPKVALVPLFIVWFGFGSTSKIIVAAVLAFFPILTNTILGVKSVHIGYREVMMSVSASRWQVIRRLDFPNALPYILTGMEVGVVLAIIGAVVGEFLAGSSGLGYLLVAYMNAYQTAKMFAVLIILTAIGFVLFLMIGWMRKWLIPWHESVFAQKIMNV